jgi:PAS domain S-box-containing protein
MEEALGEAESRYRTLVEQIPAVVYVDDLDEASTAAYVSPQIEALLGYPYSIWQTDSSFWKKCVHPEDYERAIAVTPATLERERVTEEYRMIGQDGQIIWVRDHSILVRDPNGAPRFVQGFWQDITEQRLAEENLQRQNNYLEALHQITLDLFNHREVNEVLQGIVERAAEFLNIPFCEIMLAENNELVLRAFTRNQPFLAGDRTRRGEARLSWQAFDSQQMVVVNDYAHSLHRHAMYDWLNLSAVVALPIMVGNQCIGVLNLSKAKTGNIFDESEIQAA